MRRRSTRPRDAAARRGQSEVVGFVIVLAAVIAALSAVSLLGLTALEDARETVVADNGEYAMQAVAADVEAIYYGTATSRTTELSADSAGLATGETTTITVSSGGTQLYQADIVPIVYDSEGADIVYENSVVVREQREGAVALSDPLLADESDRTVFPVVDTNASQQAAAGDGVVLHTRINGTEQVVHTGSPATITVEIDTVSAQRADVWHRLLERRLDTPTCTRPSDTTVACAFDTETLVVSAVTVEFEFR